MVTSFEPDQQLLDTTAHLLTDCAPPDLPATLVESGWLEMWEEDRETAARALFGQQGRMAQSSPMLSKLMAPVLTDSADLDLTVLLPSLSDGAQGFSNGDGKNVRVIAQADALTHTTSALAMVRLSDELELVRIEVPHGSATPVDGLDPDARLCILDIAELLTKGEVLVAGAEAEKRRTAAVALGRRLLAEEMIGVVAAQLDVAAEHARSRAQFGRSIGSFQAVKHKLAETHVALAISRLAVVEAWSDPNPVASLMAKVHAGAAVGIANRHCQQVLGGIGFTWEHSFHHYYRRGRTLDALLGSNSDLIGVVGQAINATGAVPVTAQLR
jgi:hypothetical protein